MNSPTRILLTGASGYIGGTLLVQLLSDVPLSAIDVFALVRTPAQAAQVVKMGVKPILLDMDDGEGLTKVVVQHSITIVLETVDAVRFAPAQAFIDGLAEVKKQTGSDVHFFHTSGAKAFSSHSGLDGIAPISDTSDVFELQASQKSIHPEFNGMLSLNNDIIEYAAARGVSSYIVVPPIVYGPGEGFGNKTSIQTVAIFRTIKALGKVFQVDDHPTSWAIINLLDLTSLYLTILTSILSGSAPPCNKAGFYFAENGVVAWTDLYQGIAAALASAGFVKDTTLVRASVEDLERMGEVLGCPARFVPVNMAGSCALRGDNGRKLGWKPRYGVKHLLETIGKETEFMLSQDVGKATS